MMAASLQPGDRVRIVPSEEVPNSGFRGMEGEILEASAGPLSHKPDVLVVLDDYFEPVPFFLDECYVTSFASLGRGRSV